MKELVSDTEESESECSKCALIYGEAQDKWICCDLCEPWFDLKCAKVLKANIPQ